MLTENLESTELATLRARVAEMELLIKPLGDTASVHWWAHAYALVAEAERIQVRAAKEQA